MTHLLSPSQCFDTFPVAELQREREIQRERDRERERKKKERERKRERCRETERDRDPNCNSHLTSLIQRTVLQGYLTYKKTHPHRTLP